MHIIFGTSGMAQQLKNPPELQEKQEMQVQSLGWEDSLEKERATASVFLLKIPRGRGTW